MAVQVLGDNQFRAIARETADKVRKNAQLTLLSRKPPAPGLWLSFAGYSINTATRPTNSLRR
ncbi:MAG: hypothetical protein PHG06_13060 [Parabacteroides sp.]|nr:hypothetical protein [Parabacteroides sp.]